MAKVTNEQARVKMDQPLTIFVWEDVEYFCSWDDRWVMIYDNPESAGRLLDKLGTQMLACSNRDTSETARWHNLAMVELPSDD